MPIAQLQAETARALGIYTWATKPPAAGNAGMRISVTDRGNADFVSTGATWEPAQRYDAKTGITYSGGIVTVQPFTLNGVSFTGGATPTLPDGKWFAGVDMYTRRTIALPRLGHRGWVPLAEYDLASGAVTNFSRIEPAIPVSRLPKTVAKLLADSPITVLNLGSSLSEGQSDDTWFGMVFRTSVANYGIGSVTGRITSRYAPLGGSSNAYMLAQAGIASTVLGGIATDGGYPAILSGAGIDSRSKLFADVDIVVATTIANGGYGSMDNLDAFVRLMVDRGVEVLLLSDNPANPGGIPGAYGTMSSDVMYTAGAVTASIADKYQCEYADTAAYVFAQYLQGTSVYNDSIHMSAALPAGPSATPNSGHEVYARAIRSTIPATMQASSWQVAPVDFTSTANTTAYNCTVAMDGARFVITKTIAAGGQNCGTEKATTINIAVGTKVRVTGTASGGGLLLQMTQNLVAVSDIQYLTVAGAFDVTMTCVAAVTGASIYVRSAGNGDAIGTTFGIENVVVQVLQPATASAVPTKFSDQRKPAAGAAKALSAPGDAFIILPPDEYNYRTTDANAGTIGSTGNASSFGRRFSDQVAAGQDMLTVASGKRAIIQAFGATSFFAVVNGSTGDAAASIDVWLDGSLKKTVAVPTPSATREYVLQILSAADVGNASATPTLRTCELRVTAGSIKFLALGATTFDQVYMPADITSRVGAWVGPVAGGPPNMPGFASDTSGSYAMLRAPDGTTKLWWLVSSKANSKPVDVSAESGKVAAIATVGTTKVKAIGGLRGGGVHKITLTANQSNTDQATNGYGLHIGGAIVVRDR